MRRFLRLASFALLAMSGFGVNSPRAAEFKSDWQGSRRWAGPEYWATPMYDWQVDQGVLVGLASDGRILQRLTERVEDPEKGFELNVDVEIVGTDSSSSPETVWAGFAVGVQGMMDDPRHVAVWPTRQLHGVLRADGHLMLGNKISTEKLPGDGRAALRLKVRDGKVRLEAARGGGSVSIETTVPPASLRGNIGLTAMSPRVREDARGPVHARFASWSGSGDGLVSDPSLAFGPILWSQYTRTGRVVKLNVQMPPLGAGDVDIVRLEIQREGAWQAVGEGAIDPLSRTALIRADIGTDSVPYRVCYRWAGSEHHWNGIFAADPDQAKPLKIAVFSCDNGYAFPLPTLVRNVAHQKPDLLFFAGDQIYESYGGFGVIRTPVEIAMIDYLRKYYQFGWTWRDLLKDIPSIIIPDDHDVFQGNLWGAGGHATSNQNAGGFVMAPDWVNAVQRTQTAHLPDPVDSVPIEQGIGVYFTEWRWGGVPMAILEDRKFKSGPDGVLPEDYRQTKGPMELDVPGAQLLGERQEKFLTEWSRKTARAPLRLVLSQTIFCRASTHTGRDLKPTKYDLDSNGWPQSGRRRALEPLRGNNTVMLAGDQHLGMLARQGIDAHGDGPWSFMVPGTANGFPRAWWPEGDKVIGDFVDALGNKFTVLGVANPERNSNTMNPRKDDDPETTAHRKGSGYGLLIAQPGRTHLCFEMWRYNFNAADPKPGDMFDGFPIEVVVGE